MTGVKYSFLCFPLFLIEEEKANRVAALCSQKGEGNTLLLATAGEVSINEWMSDYFFLCKWIYSQISEWEVS